MAKDYDLDLGDDFIIPPSDDKGHSAHNTFRCPPTWVRQLDRILTSGKFPYQSRGDIIRHAIYRHFKHLESLGEVPQSLLGQIAVAVNLLQEDKRNEEFRDLLVMLEERVAFHATKGSVGEARRLVLQTLGAVNQMPEGWWKSHFYDEIRKKYQWLVDQGAAKLKPGEV